MKARIICAFEIEGRRFTPDAAVIEAAPDVIAKIVSAGNADANPDAVAHAIAHGAEIIAIGTVTAAAASPTKSSRKVTR